MSIFSSTMVLALLWVFQAQASDRVHQLEHGGVVIEEGAGTLTMTLGHVDKLRLALGVMPKPLRVCGKASWVYDHIAAGFAQNGDLPRLGRGGPKGLPEFDITFRSAKKARQDFPQEHIPTDHVVAYLEGEVTLFDERFLSKASDRDHKRLPAKMYRALWHGPVPSKAKCQEGLRLVIRDFLNQFFQDHRADNPHLPVAVPISFSKSAEERKP